MLPVELTHTALVTPDILNRISNELADNTPFLHLIKQLLLFFADSYRTVFKFDHPPLHDPCAVAYVIAPELFKVCFTSCHPPFASPTLPPYHNPSHPLVPLLSVPFPFPLLSPLSSLTLSPFLLPFSPPAPPPLFHFIHLLGRQEPAVSHPQEGILLSLSMLCKISLLQATGHHHCIATQSVHGCCSTGNH